MAPEPRPPPGDPPPGGGDPEGFWERVADWLNAFVRDKNIPPVLKQLMGPEGNISPIALRNLKPDVRENVAREFMNRTDPDAPFDQGWLSDAQGGGGGGGQGGNGGGQGGGSGGGGGGGQGGGHGGHDGPVNTHNAHAIHMASMYGWNLAVLNMNDELHNLFLKAMKGNWSRDRFQAAIQDTDWYKHHSSAMRKFEILKRTDPAEFKKQMNAMEATVKDLWGKSFGTDVSQATQHHIAVMALKFGLSEAQINDRLIASVHFRKLLNNKSVGGTAAQVMNQLKAAAQSYGVRVGDGWIAQHAKDILAHNDTIDGAMNDIKELSMSRYAAFKDELDAGKTMEEIVDPYRQSMADLLEINPNQISIFNKKLQDALSGHKDKDGKAQPMTLYAFEDKVRREPRWMNTDNAKDSFMSVGSDLLRSFGLMA